MKKKVTLLLPVFAVLTYLSLSSNASGPSVGSGGNATGSPGSNSASCGTSGCHSSSAATTIDSIVVFDASINSNVTKYIAGKTYTITIHARNATKSKYGFQAIILKNSSNSSIGTLTSTMASTAVRNSGANKVVEHTSPLTLSGGHMMATFQWQAPATGSDAITIYTAVNAVNGDGNTGGDEAGTPLSKVLTDGTNVADINASISLQAYPNPVKDILNLKMENAVAGNYTIAAFDMTGKKVAEQTVNVSGAAHRTIIYTNTWASGLYQLQISKDGQAYTLPVVKQ